MASVTYDEVTKQFDDTVAVDRLDLDIADGEFRPAQPEGA